MKEETGKQIRAAWDLVVHRLSAQDNPDTANEKDFFDMVEQARRDWQTALDYFNQVVDHDLVDHAIHAMEAAEKKYTYLLKKARQEGYRLPVTLDALRGGR